MSIPPPPEAETKNGRLPQAQAAHEFLVVGVGASAGGLDACRKLIAGLPRVTGMAFLLVQHLDPNHDSLLVDLLASHSSLTVSEAQEGQKVERDHLYVIPPGKYLSVRDGSLHLSEPEAPHGARLPFDFLLRSLAEEYGGRSVCIVLSGTGADGSVGLRAVKAHQGLVIAQDPQEAAFDGMPQSAIGTGGVDLVLSLGKMPKALQARDRRRIVPSPHASLPAPSTERDLLPDIVELLRSGTSHDFTLYKPGTLRRRIERRIAMAAVPNDDMRSYLDLLHRDPAELEILAKDLLINVTSFFRDTKVFAQLAEKIIPELIEAREPDQPLRIWIAGCSTGEECYSMAMLLREHLLAAASNIKVQLFASDADPDAVAVAREGLYPATIEADVSPERLARFFVKEGAGYRVSAEMRAAIVFTVQDVLSDPPFSRLDLISCRNLLIYLSPEAQQRVISLFHFALRQGGILLLGSSETAGDVEGRFEMISKSARLYRHVGRSRPGELQFLLKASEGNGQISRSGPDAPPSRQTALAALCRRLVMESYAPAAVLIDPQKRCLYSIGPVDQYLRLPPGHPTQDLLAMAPAGLRTSLRAVIQQAMESRSRVSAPAGSFHLDVHPLMSEGEPLLLVCFVDEPKAAPSRKEAPTSDDVTLTLELRQELAATRAELQSALHDLETSSDEQKAINDEALSVNEEFQSTNEELLTSKEELQSVNEELTALNSQLQETLERQRTTSDDLQNVLYSTDVATLFLDTELRIRFFTPATNVLFNLIPGDIGRPLADLHSLATDRDLPADAQAVLHNMEPVEREIETEAGICFCRRVLPYRTQDKAASGVVITFTDITERKRTSKALEAAKLQAEQASLAKSRFLAAASHDLRQPLQTLVLLKGLLVKQVVGEEAQKLVALLKPTLGAMTGMLNALLDINQIEAGTVRAEVVSFPIGDLLERLRKEFIYHAQAKSLELHVLPCSLSVRSDPRLLEQMVRNLLSNALKYTKAGKILLGCRRRGGVLSIEVHDTGIGIPEAEIEGIFEEYRQLGNAARERSLGLGLGLSIVQRLGGLLAHPIQVRSKLGQGTVFSVGVPMQPREAEVSTCIVGKEVGGRKRDAATILVVEDDPEVRQLLKLLLQQEGYQVVTAPDGVVALAALAKGGPRPHLILTDYNLPRDLDGLRTILKLREELAVHTPAIILTGDISTAALRDIAPHGCLLLHKPVIPEELTQAIGRLLLPEPNDSGRSPLPPLPTGAGGVLIIDDDDQVRAAMRQLLEGAGHAVQDYASAEAFLGAHGADDGGCVLVDESLPGMDGLALLQRLGTKGHRIPAIMITGHGDVAMAVAAMKAGASDFLEKPVGAAALLAAVAQALERSRNAFKLLAWHQEAADQVAGLTPRQNEIMTRVLAGQPNKNIAADLGISQRTVESHRAAIMHRTGSKSLPELARLALRAASLDRPVPVPVPMKPL